MRQRDIFDNLKRFMKYAEGDFRVLEHQVPVETQMEYFNYSNHLRNAPALNEHTDFEQFASGLHDMAASLDHKRYILSALATSRQAKAFRILQEYVQNPEKELNDWAHMALMESRVMLESEFTDERQIFISTGMGGKGNRLRFYVLMLSATGGPFLDYQRQVIEREFAYTLQQNDCEIEELIIRDTYIELVILVPIQSDVRRNIENVVSECNQYGNFISTTVTLTNVKRLTAKEIAQIIKRSENS